MPLEFKRDHQHGTDEKVSLKKQTNKQKKPTKPKGMKGKICLKMLLVLLSIIPSLL